MGTGVQLVYSQPWNQQVAGDHVFRVDTLADAASTLSTAVSEPGRVALDVDGVLADIHQLFVADFNTYFEEEIREHHGKLFTTADITDYPFSKFQATTNMDVETLFMGNDEYPGFAALVEEYWEHHATIPPVEEDFPAGLHTLNNAVEETADVHAIDIVTATYGQPREVKAWLESYGVIDGDVYDRFIHETDKHELEHTLYIDDNPRLAADLQ